MGAIKKHILIGTGGALLLFAVYAVIITLAQGFSHALQQAASLWYWLAALMAGFGIQIGLFSFIRQGLKERRTTASVATSGGVSAGSMAACCAHHLGDVLPLIGVAGLAAFLVKYQLLFIVLGVLSNIVGITIMLETIQRHGLSSRIAGWRWDMARVKKGTMMSAALVFVIVAFAILVF